MCGIAGFNWKDAPLVQAMGREIAHRGPDQQGFHVEEEISLAHQRLSILDLSEHGRQPMSNASCAKCARPLWVVFNGEIYNFKEVKHDLEAKGHIFTSQCDTEVILHAYGEYGKEALHLFNGMFAFAIWDSTQHELFLVRDRLGVKPLYYYHQNRKFVFASEIKAMLKYSGISRDPNPQAIYDYLGYEFVPARETMFRDIHKLAPSHWLLFKNGQIQIERYWDIKFDSKRHRRGANRQKLQNEIIDRLSESVRKRLISDVPLGVFLSGGLDSSSVVALMTRHMKEPVKTFSLGYEDPSFSELDYARQVSKQFKTDHTEMMIEPITIPLFEKAVWHLDEPMTDLSTIPFMLICKKAKEKVTVCLSGEGGDEVFVGYDRFKASKFDQLFQRIPNVLRQHLLSPLIEKLPDQSQKKGLFNVIRRFMDGSSLPEAGHHMRWQYFLNPKNSSLLFSDEVLQYAHGGPFEKIEKILSHSSSKDRLDQEMYIDLRFTMPESVLMKVDKMSMASALEVRVPFLDYEFIEFSATIPSEWKLEGFRTKAIFRDSLRGILPENIVERGKQGYSFPIKNWLRQELKNYMIELLNESPLIKQYLKRDYINLLIQQHVARTHNHNHILWALMNLALWHKIFVLGQGVPRGSV
ncbi:MAG: asparagine synthase (glutamine-hydrolyzing) [Chlamydiae bacterium]|nr:asparagine synthase (glutamine-hydrolyzing) [Chlamydiota bacterium]MBI3276585.1 asparagine synthase (glutamine-hydrolyzing) [Chlamydiota bacterium]